LRREDITDHSSLRYDIYRFAYTYKLPPGMLPSCAHTRVR
jgi:hypothetical protein